MSPPPNGHAHPGATVATGAQAIRRDVIPFWRAVFEIARKEVLMFVRTKRLYLMGGLYALGFLALTLIVANALNGIFGPQLDDLVNGESGFRLSKANLVMAFAMFLPILGAFTFLNIVGLVFTFDGIVREYEDRSLFLILSKPVTREALVLGKFAGAAFTIGALFFSVATVAYFIAIMVVGQLPSPGDYGRYFTGLGLVFLGILALASLGLLSSAVSRTTTMSVMFSISMWLIVLNIIANSGFFYAAMTRQLEADPWYITATKYINPSLSGGPAAKIMLNTKGMQEATGSGFALDFGVFGFELDPGIMALSLIAFTLVFLFATIFVVSKRNFE